MKLIGHLVVEVDDEGVALYHSLDDDAGELACELMPFMDLVNHLDDEDWEVTA